jgi:hypothetical protein
MRHGMATMMPASYHLDPDYRRQLLRERREATARHERQDAQVVVPAPARCAYCFDRIPPGRSGPHCSDACDDAHWRLMPVW